MMLPVSCVSARCSWWEFAQGGGGALLLVLLRVEG